MQFDKVYKFVLMGSEEALCVCKEKQISRKVLDVVLNTEFAN